MYCVSVIVPFHNVERYIERCARSLFEQTLENIEFIFIDDGSTDNSLSILQDVMSNYPKRYDSINVIQHAHNIGVARSRIEGYNFAHGEYVIHCDSDDYVDKRMYEKMHVFAKRGDCDIVVCDVCCIYEDGTTNVEIGKAGVDIMKSILGPCDYLVNKLVRRSIVQDTWIKPPKCDMSEDLALSVQYALLSKNVGYIDEALYYYMHRDTSILGVRTVESMLRKQREFKENFDICISALKEKGVYQKYKPEILQKKYYVKNYAQTMMGATSVYREWMKTYPELNFWILSGYFNARQKLSYFVTMLGLYPYVSKLKRR